MTNTTHTHFHTFCFAKLSPSKSLSPLGSTAAIDGKIAPIGSVEVQLHDAELLCHASKTPYLRRID